MKMPCSATAAELAREDIPLSHAFDAWYVERLRQLRSAPGEIESALDDEEQIAVASEFLRIGRRLSHEGLGEWVRRRNAQWSLLNHRQIDKIMERESKKWREGR